MFKVRKSDPKIKQVKSHVYKSPKPKDVLAMLERLHRINRQLDEVKPLYRESDELTAALLLISDKLPKYGATVVDNFADKNTQFKVSAFKRFEIQWVKKS